MGLVRAFLYGHMTSIFSISYKATALSAGFAPYLQETTKRRRKYRRGMTVKRICKVNVRIHIRCKIR